MNFTNPNLLGMWLLLIFLSLIACSLKSKNRKYNYTAYLCCVLLIPIMIKCDARNTVFPLLFSIALSFFINNNNRLKILTIFSMWFPIIFVIIYLNFIDTIMNIGFLKFLVSEGKALDSRYYIWKNLVSILNNNLFLGNYYLISGGTGVSQCLNTHLDILCSYGVFVYVMTVALLTNKYLKIGESISQFSIKERIVYAICVSVTLIVV